MPPLPHPPPSPLEGESRGEGSLLPERSPYHGLRLPLRTEYMTTGLDPTCRTGILTPLRSCP